MSREREKLNEILNLNNGVDFPQYALNHWQEVKPLIENWWKAYKAWEKDDTFAKAFQDDRMSVRTFSDDFNAQKSKTFQTLTLNSERFFPNSNYNGRLETTEQGKQKNIFDATGQTKLYHANRGIDGSAFANPDNFKTTQKKYEEGLHDLSASLINHNVSIFNQIHNKGEGAHFVFLPLSEPEDQAVLYNLIRAAKILKPQLIDFYSLIREYRAKMTRVKLAAEFDMAVGYIAVPTPNGNVLERQFKLRYGLGGTTTIKGNNNLIVTPEVYQARQQVAINFKSILAIRQMKNEIVVAVRQHTGPFPVYAVRKEDKLHCFTIVGGNLTLNGKTISKSGVMT